MSNNRTPEQARAIDLADEQARAQDQKERQEAVQSEYGCLVGRTIVSVRSLTDDERNYSWLGWGDYGLSWMIVLDDGTTLIPSRDDEGNGPGTLFINYEFEYEDEG
jgi:hypothetical protein